MNDELETKEYLKNLEQLRLLDSSRVRIKEELLAYAKVHSVPEESIAKPSPYAAYLKFSYAPVLVAGLLFFGVTTWRAVPGDSLFALKSTVGQVFGIDMFNETRLATLPPKPTESTESLSIETESSADNNLAFNAPPKTTISNSPANEAVADADMNARSGIMMKESDSASSDVAFTTTLAQGSIDIDDYLDDVVLREKTYRELVTKHDMQIADDIRAELIARLNTTTALMGEAEGRDEESARPLLDKASILLGEVESTLSLLGSVTVEEGVIIDIDFGGETTE